MDGEAEKESLRELARICGIGEKDIINAYQQVQCLSPSEQQHLVLQPAAAANAVESILNQRNVFRYRLQQIANLTQKL